MFDETEGQAPTAPETVPDAQQVAETPESAPEAEQQAEPQEAPPKKSGFQERIDKLTRDKREAERRAERAERKLREAEQKPLDDLEYDDQIAERTIRRSKAEQVKEEYEVARELAHEVFEARAEELRAKYDDYDAVALGDWTCTEVMAEAIRESDMGPQIAYYLGKNKAEAAKIAALRLASQAAAIGRLEAKLSAPSAPRNPPPAPPSPVNGVAAGVQKDPAKMTMAEYVAWRNAGNT